MELSPIHEFEIDIAGRLLFLRRSLELARRIESVVGALEPFVGRLDRGQVTFAELSRFYLAIVHGRPDAPSQKEIETWLFERGLLTHKGMAFFVMTLIVGSEILTKLMEQRDQQTSKADGGEGGRGPFVRAA